MVSVARHDQPGGKGGGDGKLAVDELPSPLGVLYLVARGPALCAVAFADGWDREREALCRRFGPGVVLAAGVPASLRQALVRYFDGELAAIDTVPVDLGGTPFQRRVWAALRRVPAGATASYGDIAAAVGRPTAVRAVGAANGRNPVPIVVPCHRVVAADGTLHGYGGGLPRKRWLLDHEGALAPLFAP